MNTYGQSLHYSESKGEKYFSYQNRNASLGARIDAMKFAPFVKSTDCVLDFGCGGGWLLGELPALGKYGIELNPIARDCCRQNGISVYASIADLPVGLNFDTIISHHALEHVPYPIQALRELRAKLKPNGRAVLVVPIDDWRVQKDFSGTDIDHHLHTWTPRLFANTLVESGFHVKTIRIITHAWPPFIGPLSRLPRSLFALLCILWSVVRRRRQLVAVALPKPE